MKFEYLVIAYSEAINGNLVEFLNQFGEKGWELIQILPSKTHLLVFFKREKQ